VADLHPGGSIAELVECRFHRVVAENPIDTERVLWQNGDDLLQGPRFRYPSQCMYASRPKDGIDTTCRVHEMPSHLKDRP